MASTNLPSCSCPGDDSYSAPLAPEGLVDATSGAKVSTPASLPKGFSRLLGKQNRARYQATRGDTIWYTLLLYLGSFKDGQLLPPDMLMCRLLGCIISQLLWSRDQGIRVLPVVSFKRAACFK